MLGGVIGPVIVLVCRVEVVFNSLVSCELEAIDLV